MRRSAIHFQALATVLALACSAFAPAQEIPILTPDQVITDPGRAFEDDRFTTTDAKPARITAGRGNPGRPVLSITGDC